MNIINTIITIVIFEAFSNNFKKGITIFTVGCSSTFIGGFLLCTTGPIGGIIGLGLMAFGICNFVILLGISFLTKKALEFYIDYNSKIKTFLLDSKEKVLKDFDDRIKIILNKINKSLEGIKLRLHASNDTIYKKKCEEFKRIKNELREKSKVH